MTLPALRDVRSGPNCQNGNSDHLPIERAMLGVIRCRVRLSLFTEIFAELDLTPGPTLAELLAEIAEAYPIAPHCSDLVWLQGREIKPEHRGLIRPKSGAILCVARVPGDARTALLLGGTLAVAALSGGVGLGVAGLVGGGTLGAIAGGVAASGVAIGGSISLNALE